MRCLQLSGPIGDAVRAAQSCPARPNPEKGGIAGALGVAEEVPDISLACAADAPKRAAFVARRFKAPMG
jgi:hypothetical protein